MKNQTTKNTTHTRGPWTLAGRLTIQGYCGDEIIASVHRMSHEKIGADAGDSDPYAESKANARLIAAAPDLLAALKTAAATATHERICEFAPGNGLCACRVAIFRAAILRAEDK